MNRGRTLCPDNTRTVRATGTDGQPVPLGCPLSALEGKGQKTVRRWVLEVEADNSAGDALARLRRLLKAALRGYGFKVTRCEKRGPTCEPVAIEDSRPDGAVKHDPCPRSARVSGGKAS